MNKETLINAVAEYISVLGVSLNNTNYAEDRNIYKNHLAHAALMFVCINRNEIKKAKELIEQEQRSYGWGYLSGDYGEAAHNAWAEFQKVFNLEVND